MKKFFQRPMSHVKIGFLFLGIAWLLVLLSYLVRHITSSTATSEVNSCQRPGYLRQVSVTSHVGQSYVTIVAIDTNAQGWIAESWHKGDECWHKISGEHP